MSMSAYHRAMMDFLGQLSLPVHLTGLTPDASHFPYLTCTMGSTAFAGPSLLTATAWFLGPDAMADRAALCDRAQELMPESGVSLHFDGGAAVIYRPSGDFITLLTDGEDPRVLGARMRLMVKLYDL
ncbi:MAG: hypothetical protein ACI4MJ_07075 [Aristaeellaceae bacterium]